MFILHENFQKNYMLSELFYIKRKKNGMFDSTPLIVGQWKVIRYKKLVRGSNTAYGGGLTY